MNYGSAAYRVKGGVVNTELCGAEKAGAAEAAPAFLRTKGCGYFSQIWIAGK